MECLNFAIKEVAYDNGAVFRGQTEDEVMKRVWLALTKTSTNEMGFSIHDLNLVEDALERMTHDEIRDIAIDSPEGGAEVIARYNISVETQVLIDEVLNVAFDHL